MPDSMGLWNYPWHTRNTLGLRMGVTKPDTCRDVDEKYIDTEILQGVIIPETIVESGEEVKCLMAVACLWINCNTRAVF